MTPHPTTPETISEEEPAKPPCANPVQMWPIDRPKPNPDNARIHPDEQVGQVVNSIKTFQALRPILVDEHGYILAGHAILLAHQRLGRQQIAVQVIDHLTELQKRAFLIADNQIALNSEWDDQKLSALIATLEKELDDVSVLGFDPEELDRLLHDLAPEQIFVDEDEVPVPPVQSVSLPGDVWILDKHRLLCGDSTQAESLAAVLEGSLADMVFGDAPYNVAYRQKRARRPEGIAIANDDLGEEFEQFPLLGLCATAGRVPRGCSICACPRRSCTPYSRRLRRRAGTGRHSSSGQRIVSRWGAQTISGNTNRSCMAGARARNTSGMGPAIRATSGLCPSPRPIVCIPR